MISCGEASGDLYAGALGAALRRRTPDLELFGFGGGHLARAGAELLGDYRRFAVTGLVEAAAVLPRSWRMLQTLRAAARDRHPDVFVAIDFPDFNFRLLPALSAAGIPIVYYVSPQIWAWRPGRMSYLKRYVSRMLVIFPFEPALYEKAGVPVEFVGHPLVDLAIAATTRDAWLGAVGLDPTRPVVALLPGSRPNEVSRLLPVLVESSVRIAARVPGVQFVIARAPSLDDDLFADAGRRGLRVVTGATDDVLQAADAVVTASGTATVQTALHGKPMVIVYRLSPATYALGRSFVRLPHYGMVNLVAGRSIVPELIQDACTPEAVAAEAVSLLTDRGRADRMRQDLTEVQRALGGAGASERAADAVLAVATSDVRGRSAPDRTRPPRSFA
jgi:lipid-A-disaccharide synthase